MHNRAHEAVKTQTTQPGAGLSTAIHPNGHPASGKPGLPAPGSIIAAPGTLW